MNKIFNCIFNKNLIFLVCFSFLYLPMIILIIYSFNESQFMMTWSNFSLHWYMVLFQDKEMINAVMLSIYIAIITATTSIILGTIISFITVRFGKKFFYNSISIMFNTVLVIPDIVNGLSLLLFFITINYLFNFTGNNGIITIWLSHTTFCTAYVAILITKNLREQDIFVEEAAISLGANPIKVFFLIHLPMIFPSIFAGWLLAFSLSLDDLVIASFVTRPGTVTLPMQIFAMVRRGISPEINALSSIVLFIVGIISYIFWKILLKNKSIIY